MLKAILIIVLATVATQAMAGWFGPSNYEECVLGKLKEAKHTTGSYEDLAKSACRISFPCPEGEFARYDHSCMPSNFEPGLIDLSTLPIPLK
jgi:hypothetical protein